MILRQANQILKINLNEENNQTPSKNDLKKTLQKHNYTYVGIKQHTKSEKKSRGKGETILRQVKMETQYTKNRIQQKHS